MRKCFVSIAGCLVVAGRSAHSNGTVPWTEYNGHRSFDHAAVRWAPRIYLNSLPDGCGGETSFERPGHALFPAANSSAPWPPDRRPRLGVSVRPQAGAALVWPNVSWSQQVCRLHRGASLREVDAEGRPQNLVEHRSLWLGGANSRACKTPERERERERDHGKQESI